MSQDELPIGEMKYSFKAYVQARGFAGDLIITSTTVTDLVKSIQLLERVGIEPMGSANRTSSSIPICPVHQRPMKPSKRPGSFYCSVQVNDGYCPEEARE
ncbi:MAG: hypothetical protein M3R24_28100 [Chloroflexota bacterium]|nr:hypothetical protein [Chloroflexota bacterium]PLS78873.1 MAG: hypothetical protein CYG59_16180 [Chloroflexota bacterium]